MIPRMGDRVVSRKTGKTLLVLVVTNYRERLESMSELDARMFIQAVRASHGEDWASTWFEVMVIDEAVENAKPELLGVADLEPIEGSICN